MMYLEDYIKRRDQALIDIDIDWVMANLQTLSSREVALITIHKTRYECTGIADLYRYQSRDYLAKNGYVRMGGGKLLPGDQLPAGLDRFA